MNVREGREEGGHADFSSEQRTEKVAFRITTLRRSVDGVDCHPHERGREQVGRTRGGTTLATEKWDSVARVPTSAQSRWLHTTGDSH